jgi:MscS family membrane protein
MKRILVGTAGGALWLFGSARALAQLDGASEDWWAAFWGLDPEQWTWLAGIVAGSIIVAWPIRLVADALLRRWSHRPDGAPQPGKARWTSRAIQLVATVLLLDATLPWAHLPSPADAVLDQVANLLQIVAVAWLAIALWDTFCDLSEQHLARPERKARSLIAPILRRVGRMLIVLCAGVALIAALGYNVWGILAGLGLGGIAVALAAKDSVENLFGTLSIVMDMPFGVGDWIKVGDVEGTVEQITLRSTKLRTYNDSVVTLPNTNLVKASVDNYGARRWRRLKIGVVVDARTPSEAIEGYCQQVTKALQEHPAARSESVSVTLHDITDLGPKVRIEAFIEAPDFRAELAVRHELLVVVLRVAEQCSISLADRSGAGA